MSPRAIGGSITTGVSAINIEGTSITPTLISTPNVVNSCASNPITGKTVCTANNTDVYVLTGTTLNTTFTSGGSRTISFSGGSCTNCGVAMDAVHNHAVIGLSIAGAARIPDPSISTIRSCNRRSRRRPALSRRTRWSIRAANCCCQPPRTTITRSSTSQPRKAPTFFENPIPSTASVRPIPRARACTTGIALAPGEFSSPSNVFIADLTQAKFTSGSPSGTWTAPSQVQTLTKSFLSAGASGIAVAQGTHTGIVSGEFGGNTITAIALPATSGAGIPAIGDWVSCNIAGLQHWQRSPHGDGVSEPERS